MSFSQWTVVAFIFQRIFPDEKIDTDYGIYRHHKIGKYEAYIGFDDSWKEIIVDELAEYGATVGETLSG